MRKLIALILESALILGGLALLYFQFFVWLHVEGQFLVGAGMMIAIGLVLIYEDLFEKSDDENT